MGFTQVLAVLKSRRRALFAVWGGVVVLALAMAGLQWLGLSVWLLKKQEG